MLDEILCRKFDELLLKAKGIATAHIQKRLGGTLSKFTWVDSESHAPLFDDMAFQYDGRFFSVFIKILHNGHEISDLKRQDRMELFRSAVQDYEVIPCIFPVEFEFLPPDCQPGEPITIDPENLPDYRLIPCSAKNLNLLHVETDRPIDISRTHNERHNDN